MTTGWDAASEPIALAAPWDSFWVRAYLDPPIGDYLDMQAALTEAQTHPTEDSLDALVATIPVLLAEHNITGRDGAPIEWRARSLGAKLITAIAGAIKRVQDESGAPADPLPQKRRQATSRRRE